MRRHRSRNGERRRFRGPAVRQPGNTGRQRAGLVEQGCIGFYAYVNHNLIEAVELGATAHFTVEGKWDDDLMTQVTAPHPVVKS
jgi:hypothetical protein